jgi:hypothetical protein
MNHAYSNYRELGIAVFLGGLLIRFARAEHGRVDVGARAQYAALT